MHIALPGPLAIALTGLTLAGLLAAPPAHADAGHDHGAAAPKAGSPGLPRFAAASEAFELVGVLNGRQLTLYLDRSADNSPVNGAKLELELAGGKVEVKPRGDGEFEATLAQPLSAGTTAAVTATVVAGGETDLLAGELVVPAEGQADAPQARNWQRLAAWGGVALVGLIALGTLAWLARRAWGRRVAHTGAAA